jgi:hypothetical protein
MEILFKTQAAAHTAAIHDPADALDGQAGDLGQQCFVRAADALLALVTGGKVDHAPVNPSKSGIQPFFPPQTVQVRPHIHGMFRFVP